MGNTWSEPTSGTGKALSKCKLIIRLNHTRDLKVRRVQHLTFKRYYTGICWKINVNHILKLSVTLQGLNSVEQTLWMCFFLFFFSACKLDCKVPRLSDVNIRTKVSPDGMSVLQGKLEGCTVNSHGVILNHTTYYLNLDAHGFFSSPQAAPMSGLL